MSHPSTGTPVAVDVVQLLRAALDTNPDAVREALTLRPCHITGLHTPEHHLECTCPDQRAGMLSLLLEALGIGEHQLPRGLHSRGCHWCHDIPSQEQYRDRLRRTWQWAGVELTDAIKKTASDGWHPGDDEAVLAAYQALHAERGHDTWLSNTEVHNQLEASGRADIGFERLAIVKQKMTDHGLLEETCISLLYHTRLTAAADQLTEAGTR